MFTVICMYVGKESKITNVIVNMHIYKVVYEAFHVNPPSAKFLARV